MKFESDYIIISDAASDLDKSIRERFGIEYPICGKLVFPNNEVKTIDPDWNNISFDEFYKIMENKQIFKTSLPNPFEVRQQLEKFFIDGKDVLVISISSKLSGAYQVFNQVKTELETLYPPRKMLIVDSLRYGSAIGLLCIKASLARKNGVNITDNYNQLMDKRLSIHQSGIIDDLFFLSRSGRLSYSKALFGSMVGIKPIADFCNETGMSFVIGKIRGYKKAFNVIKQYIVQTISSEEKFVCIAHSYREERAMQLKAILESEFKDKEIIFCKVGQSSGCSIGPGLLAIFYFSDTAVSPYCEIEKKLLERILKNERL